MSTSRTPSDTSERSQVGTDEKGPSSLGIWTGSRDEDTGLRKKGRPERRCRPSGPGAVVVTRDSEAAGASLRANWLAGKRQPLLKGARAKATKLLGNHSLVINDTTSEATESTTRDLTHVPPSP